MNEFGLTFQHFGLAVREPTSAFTFLRALGYEAGASCFDAHQRVNLAMRHHAEMPDVEVIWPGDVPSPLDQMLKRSDSLIYHLCYVSDNVRDSIAAFESCGLEVMAISEPAAAPLFDGLEVSFYSIAGYGIIEIIETRGSV